MNGAFNTIDLFAGCGGLTEGFKKQGKFKSIACVEWEKKPSDTLVRRLRTKWKYLHADEIVMQFDIQQTESLFTGWKEDKRYQSHPGLDYLVRNGGQVDVVIGGPPCQAYSIAGRIRDSNGMKDDYRNYLFESYTKVVDRYQPKLFVFENVPGILSALPNGISILSQIKSAFSKIGYEISESIKQEAVVNASDFGVPQNRKRVIIVGIKRSSIRVDPQEALSRFYNEILPKFKSEGRFTVRNAISDLPKIYPLDAQDRLQQKASHAYPKKSVLNHIPRFHNQRDIEIFKTLSMDIDSESFKYVSVKALHDFYTSRTGKSSNVHKYYVLRWDEPSNTIPAHLYKDGLRHIHPDPRQARSITVREAARLQSFDDDFEFIGSLGDQYKMIGNAVPPNLAKAIALAINELLKKYF